MKGFGLVKGEKEDDHSHLHRTKLDSRPHKTRWRKSLGIHSPTQVIRIVGDSRELITVQSLRVDRGISNSASACLRTLPVLRPAAGMEY
jgi:hypothetical protein